MEKIVMEATPTTPKIILDPAAGQFDISGKSLPENSFEFYRPILEWMDNYAVTCSGTSTLSFRLEYFNTSSTSHFLKIIKKLEKLHVEGKSATVLWYHDPDDDDMREAGEDFKLLVRMPIEIIAAESPSEDTH